MGDAIGAALGYQSNHLPIVPGSNYVFGVYRPQPEVLDRTWTFPRAQPV